ncbi:uncharacterized protein LOC119765461 isoform X3 [Culex quinquefasciatus]|uniref:uncharacterized protein LOC119765461 isoform X3 n=1 Tax=Culex quinquefasciatus TaxID=7176 RepID=UPI0018E2DADD|nr:uncharacterized protein LOC119765461 isoform X3 [Culex quinquefasciatus]
MARSDGAEYPYLHKKIRAPAAGFEPATSGLLVQSQVANFVRQKISELVMSDESMELGPATQAEIFDVEQFLEDCDEEFALHGNHQQREEREQNAGEEREQNVGEEGEALQGQLRSLFRPCWRFSL